MTSVIMREIIKEEGWTMKSNTQNRHKSVLKGKRNTTGHISLLFTAVSRLP